MTLRRRSELLAECRGLGGTLKLRSELDITGGTVYHVEHTESAWAILRLRASFVRLLPAVQLFQGRRYFIRNGRW